MSNLTLWSRPVRPAWDTDRWLRNFFGPAATADWYKPLTSEFNPAAEIVRDGDNAVVRLELPGVDVDKDVTVELEPGHRASVLVIRGEHRDEHAPDAAGKDGRALREIRYGSFRRSFQLPEHVTSEAIAASYDAGVLTVRVTDAYKDPAAAQPQRIAITK
ncbi:Hsp20/alpha crystallin family protein [Mycobacterium spongiae]|uniref:Hsp20 family protein n=1 Tax=Mycobacterium spongiae TaxID=886343 RepID=A0A975JWK3_9MYCO|nr:Hsp20/alpha crystallin family protein [Mycobacterium spongiae]QUR66008.1 Hsp20 family protein [Mycobacterium spongiae]